MYKDEPPTEVGTSMDSQVVLKAIPGGKVETGYNSTAEDEIKSFAVWALVPEKTKKPFK